MTLLLMNILIKEIQIMLDSEHKNNIAKVQAAKR